MNFEETNSHPNPLNGVDLLSRIFFWSAIPLFRKGRKGKLKLDDVFNCPDDDTTAKIGNTIQKEWSKELEKLKRGKEPSLPLALIRAFGLKYCFFGSFALLYFSLCELGRAILLGNIIKHISQVPSSAQDMYLNAAGMCFLVLLGTFLYQQYNFEMARAGMTMKTACCLLIYKKALKISQFSLSSTSVGQVVNLLSNDVNKFDEASFYLPFLIVGPIHFSIVLYVVWIQVGYTGMAGMALLLMYLPIQILMGKVSAALRLKTAYLTDKRINLMSGIIDQIRGIKMYGWELPFANLVDQSRRKEIKKVCQVHVIRSMNLIMYCLSYKVMLLISVAVFVLSVGGDLTPEKVFTCIMLFYSVRAPMIYSFTQSISNGAEALTSFKRIQKFLLLEEHSQSLNLRISNEECNPNECEIFINKIGASWQNAALSTLRNITLNVKSGDLVAIVGPVGCGKTSLLMTILGELPIISGETTIKGRVAFASQEPWIFDGTVRQNITFGSDFDNSRYKAVINACALSKDIRSFPHGDMTTVGERGVRLSGGQKARLNLARAIYLDADIFLLDDPLSAVDSSVSKHLFDKCIDGFLKNKIRILVTHQLQYLRRASKVLVMENGMCSAIGTYQELIQAGIEFSSFVEDPKQKQMERSLSKSTSSKICIDEDHLNCIDEDVHTKSMCHSDTLANEHVEEEIMFHDSDAIPKYMKETKFSGSVKRNVYKKYIMSGGGALFVTFVLFSQLTTQAFMNGSDFWLTNWSSLEQLKYNIRICWRNLTTTFLNATGYYDGTMNQSMMRVNFPDSNDDCKRITENYTMGVDDMAEIINEQYQTWIYGCLLLTLVVLYVIRVSSFYKLCMASSVTLHDRLFRNILRSPTSFFDSVPVGNILNRVSQDLGVIDEALPLSSMLVSETLVDLLGIVIVTFIAEPCLILVAALLAICSFNLSRIYLSTARDLKRYESITRSPIFTLLNSCLNGLTTIRNLKIQNPLERLFMRHQDKHTSTFIAFAVCAHCFCTFVDIICNLYATCVTVAMILLSGDPSFAARAGLAIAVSLQLCARLQWGMKFMADVESQMTSVERVLDYSNLESEADLESKPEKRPPKNWPLKGHIVYKNVNLRYFPNHDPVLKDLNFEIYPKEKIGIVGRTGAGKSSLISSLLRLTEPEGLIEIDNVCTKDIGLHDLRKRITIIPQDPTLFIGTVRKNLDPFDEHTDSEIWQALEEVYLKETVHLLPGGLDANVLERGSNFSVGQRQLICLARAILRRNRILVLDEATANVDINTDRLIQLAIRSRFADCTILIIAHRLHTIMDADRVIVMENGEIKEFDTPHHLIQKSDGIFSHMLKMTGEAMAKQLKNIAAATHLKRISTNQMVSDLKTKDQVMGNLSETLAHVMNENIFNGHVNMSYDDIEMSHL